MKYLIVGDVHAKDSNLPESAKLINFITESAKSNGISDVIFLGDQLDTMSVVKVSVLNFWKAAFKKMKSDGLNVISLVGNHDLDNEYTNSSMIAFVDDCHVIKNLTQISDKIFAVGYVKDNDTFITIANEAFGKGCKTLLCHAEVNGAQMENGFYAPHGIDLDKLPSMEYISGHIHKKQSITNNCLQFHYLGTPRMLTRSDIGEIKGIHIYDPMFSNFKAIPTPREVCEPFEDFVFDEKKSDLNTMELINSDKIYVDLHGSKDYVKAMIKKMPDKVKIRTFVTDEMAKKDIEFKESDGINKSFSSYLSQYVKTKQLNEKAEKDIAAIIYELCPILKQ